MHEIKVFAPILIPTLCRFEHLKRCIESLSKCTHADKSDLYIALDFPLNESHEEGYKKICNYLNNEIIGFKSINIIKREKNYGAWKNLKLARIEIFKKYDRIIISEDDNEFSPNFLDYINKGLEIYKDNNDILFICGYNYPINISKYKKNIYCSDAFSAWGYGITKDKYMNLYSKVFDSSIDYSHKVLSSFSLSFKLFKKRVRILDALIYMHRKNAIHGDTLIEAYQLLNSVYSIFPTVSIVRNCGHDGSGLHCGITDLYLKQKIDNKSYFNFDNIDILKNNYCFLKLKRLNKYNLISKIAVVKHYLMRNKKL